MDKVPMTLAGFDRLESELKRLKGEERPAVIRALAEARDLGDLSENAEYQAARERQSFIEGRVGELEDKIGGPKSSTLRSCPARLSSSGPR